VAAGIERKRAEKKRRTAARKNDALTYRSHGDDPGWVSHYSCGGGVLTVRAGIDVRGIPARKGKGFQQAEQDVSGADSVGQLVKGIRTVQRLREWSDAIGAEWKST